MLKKQIGEGIIKYVTLINLCLILLICKVSGSNSPSWILFIAPLVPAIFGLPKIREKIIFILLFNVLVGLGNFLGGKSFLYIVQANLAIFSFSIVLFRSYYFSK
jgi:hypothetical protein